MSRMSPVDVEAQPTVPPVWRRLVRSPAAWGAAALVAAVVTVTGLLGGWAPARLDDLSDLPAGQSVELGPLAVTVRGWDYLERPAFWGEDPVDRFVALWVTVTGTADQPYVLPGSDLVLTDVETDYLVQIVRMRDLTPLISFTPGLTEDVIVLFPLADGADAPAVGQPIEIVPGVKVLREHSLTREVGWWSMTYAGRLPVPHDGEFLATLRAADEAEAAGSDS